MSNTTRQPMAWGIQWGGDTKPDLDYFFSSRYEAEMHLSARVVSGTIVPVYLDPPPATLTDEERKLLQKLETSGSLDGFMLSDKHRKTLRRLLARRG